jgi:hypothetical protein
MIDETTEHHGLVLREEGFPMSTKTGGKIVTFEQAATLAKKLALQLGRSKVPWFLGTGVLVRRSAADHAIVVLVLRGAVGKARKALKVAVRGPAVLDGIPIFFEARTAKWIAQAGAAGTIVEKISEQSSVIASPEEQIEIMHDIVARCMALGFVQPTGVNADGEVQYVLTDLGRTVAKSLFAERGISEQQLRTMSLPELSKVVAKASN